LVDQFHRRFSNTTWKEKAMTRVVFITGAPRSGKSTVSKHLLYSAVGKTGCTSGMVITTSEALKRAVHSLIGMFNISPDTFETLKDSPLDSFNGLTPRRAYIKAYEFGASIFGPAFLGDSILHRMSSAPSKCLIITDPGRREEAARVIHEVGAYNCMHIHIERGNMHTLNTEGVAYTIPADGLEDSRFPFQLNAEGVPTYVLRNNSTLDQLHARADSIIDEWVQYLSRANPRSGQASALGASSSGLPTTGED
jgi:hypothetical protein